MKVIFTHAYFLQQDDKEKEVMKPYPPLGILSISAWLEKHGIFNEVYDSTFSSQEDQRNYLLQNKPEVLAIYTNLMTKIQVASLIDFIRSEEKLASAFIVLGGPDVTFNIANYLGLGADVLVIGEGEQTMLELVQTCTNGRPVALDHIHGIAYTGPDGEIITTPARAKLNQIDELPFPDRRKIDLKKYLDTWKKHHGRSSVSISTQRGCPYTCRWCSTAVYGQSYRRRSPSLVVDEMIALQNEYAPDQIWFVDDVFTISHKWLREFRDQVISRQVTIPFECISRADRMNEEVIGLLKEAGCFRVWIGAESGSQRILDAMDRRVDARQVQDIIIAARREGLEAGTFIMLGYPGETEDDIFLTLDHLRRADPDLFTISVAYPIKGTPLYEETEPNHQKNLIWSKTTDRAIHFKRTYSARYYDFAIRWLVNNMRINKMKLKKLSDYPSAFILRLKIYISRLGMIWFKSLKAE